jgi:hypothetical protein
VRDAPSYANRTCCHAPLVGDAIAPTTGPESRYTVPKHDATPSLGVAMAPATSGTRFTHRPTRWNPANVSYMLRCHLLVAQKGLAVKPSGLKPRHAFQHLIAAHVVCYTVQRRPRFGNRGRTWDGRPSRSASLGWTSLAGARDARLYVCSGHQPAAYLRRKGTPT